MQWYVRMYLNLWCSLLFTAAGIYVVEWPKLDYGTTYKYVLTIKCYDTGNTEASGTFTVNIIENQKPIFVNLESK